MEIIRTDTIDRGLGEYLWCCKAEDKAHKNHTIIHSAHKEAFNFLWYESCPALLDFNIFGWKVEARINTYLQQIDPQIDDGYYTETTATKSVIRFWEPNDPNTIYYCTTSNSSNTKHNFQMEISPGY